MAYASKTEVTTDKSQAEIRRLIKRAGADRIASLDDRDCAIISFEMNGRRVIFKLPLPQRNDNAFNLYKQGKTTFQRTDSAVDKLYEQACRSRWRSLLLAIKAKLESVESGIETFEEAFLAQTVMPNGQTVFEGTKETIKQAYLNNAMPKNLLFEGPR